MGAVVVDGVVAGGVEGVLVVRSDGAVLEGVVVPSAGARRLPALSGSEASPMRWLESRLAASDTPAATARPAIASTTQPMIELPRIALRYSRR